MKHLEEIEEIRLQNFRELQSRSGRYGAPTAAHLSKVLTRAGAKFTSPQLTAIYQREQAITTLQADQIEQALSLPNGWLSKNHDFLFSLTPFEIDVHSALAALPTHLKLNLAAIINHIAKAGSSPLQETTPSSTGE